MKHYKSTKDQTTFVRAGTAETENLEKRLREEILAGLKKVTRANSPHLWSAIHKTDGTLNVNGYQKVEERLIQRIISGKLTPLAAIPQLEQELDLM